MRVLDIDLDFFLNDRYTNFGGEPGRLDDNCYKPWSIAAVKRFLKGNCGVQTPIKGKFFQTHDEVFYYIRELQEVNDFALRFEFDHIDAHADLGQGDSSYAYISSEILPLPITQRCYPGKIKGWEGLSEGNFLSFAIACRWITRLNHISQAKWERDLQAFLCKDFSLESNAIQLKCYTPSQMHEIIFYGDLLKKAMEIEPVSLEPEVPYRTIDYKDFHNDQPYDLFFLTQSPDYTPKSSDSLIPIICEYISEF